MGYGSSSVKGHFPPELVQYNPIEITKTYSTQAVENDTSVRPLDTPLDKGWLRGSVVERWSLTSELSLSCARPAADG